MARGRSLERDLDAVAALRSLDDQDALRDRLRRALDDRRPLIAGKAARVAADRGVSELAPEIAAALDRLLGDEDPDTERPADPGCLGKTDLARALVDLAKLGDLGPLGDDVSTAFLRGARCVQMEAVWGGQSDAAGELRGLCAMGLAGSSDPRAAEALADLLADPEAAARSGAVRGLAASGRVGAELLLRFKTRLGDDAPTVLLDAFSGLLELEPRSGLEPIADGLASDDEERFEAAAIALGSSRHPEALTRLAAVTGRQLGARRQRILFRALALIRGDEAVDYLASLVAEAPKDEALRILETLGEIGVDHRLRDRLGEVVAARRDRDLSRAHRALGAD